MNNRISKKTRDQVFERDGYKCASCGIEISLGMGDLHHVIPKNKGGSNDPSNLITLCRNCNYSIADKIFEVATTPLSAQLAKIWVGLTAKSRGC
jgi:5-methylcytosine-specific restriction endonuclease McrA